jgi:mRNA deadenylase 3'-5' endonuclease subunit Ccr4
MIPDYPLKRNFLKFPVQEIPRSICHENIRVLQYNMLADGLSGGRDDLGWFSRVSAEDLKWEKRKKMLLKELQQYSPDVITMQENDHYYDFFLAELSILGYDGFFAPKPASACLEVSDRSDGCSIFVRRSLLKVISSQTITYVLSAEDRNVDIREFNSYAQVSEERRGALRAQNQVALVLVCELRDEFRSLQNVPPIVIATTHLKATKSEAGERFRQREVLQYLDYVSKVVKVFFILKVLMQVEV